MTRTVQTARKSRRTRTKIKVEDNVTLPSSAASQPARSSVGKTSNEPKRDTIRRPRSKTPSDSESEEESISQGTGSQLTGPPRKRRRVLAGAPSASAPNTPHMRRAVTIEPPRTSSTASSTSSKSHPGENQSPSPSSTDDGELATSGEDGDEVQTSTEESCDSDCSSNTSEQEPQIQIEAEDDIHSVAFLADGKDVVGCGKEKKIRRWHVEDGKEVEIPLDVAEIASSMVVSQDGRWICETIAGKVRVWNAESYEKVIEFHGTWASAIAISPDAIKIATGSDDFSVNIWSLSTGERLLGPLQHDSLLHLIKFSPDGRLLATAARSINSIRIYDSQDGHLLGDFPVQLPCVFANQSIAWTSDCKHLFALGHDGKIHDLDVYSGSMGNHWFIHSTINPTCVALSNDGTFIAASAGSSISVWDTTTYKQIEGAIDHSTPVICMAISSNYDLVTCDGGTKISLWNLCDVLPSPYSGNLQQICDIRKRRANTQSSKTAQSEYVYDHNVKNAVEELRNQLVDSQSVVKKTEDGLNETAESLRTDLRSVKLNSVDLEKTLEELVDDQLFDFQLKTDDLILQLRTRLSNAQRKTDDLAKVLLIDQQKWRCEFLYADGQVIDAALSLIDIVKKEGEDVFADWLPVFRNKCVSGLAKLGDEAAKAGKTDEALAMYSTALSLGPPSLNNLLIKWVRTMLISSSPNDVRGAATKLKLPTFNIHHTICNVLEEEDRAAEAVEYFQEVQGELVADENIHNVQARWEQEFQRRCVQKLEKRAADAMESQRYQEAIEHYTAVLSLDTADRVDVLIKRCKAQVIMTSWEDALNDAQEAMKVKESLLHQGPGQDDEDSLRRHAEAAEAFETLLRKLLK